jgi:DNA-binding response OmpR family regulator
METEHEVNAPLVCIVEDEVEIREIYARKFTDEGFRTVLAVDGEDGMEKIRATHPDIVMLDLNMPVRDGEWVLQELRGDPVLSMTPVIILSNIDDESMFTKAGPYGTCRYMTKALTTPSAAAKAVREVLGLP